MSGRVEDIRQELAEALALEAEQAAVIDLEDIDREAALAQLHREPDQPVWRQA
jgi:hypothetical protein